MTGTYDWNPMPHTVEVSCPECSNHAIFEFAEVVRIELKKDIKFFEDNDLFEYKIFSDSCGHKWHGALYFAGLHGNSTSAISELPDGYKREFWSHSKYLYRSHGTDLGSIRCTNCNLNKKHILKWPNEAYFSVEHKGEQLWAFNRESSVDLRDFIKSIERNVDDYKWRNFLLHIPTVFKKKNNRDIVVKKLNRLLAC